MADTKAPQNVLIHIIRRDLRSSDNPLLHAAATAPDAEKFDAHLPLFVFDASQVNVSGFIKHEGATNPYKPARSQIAGYHRCGPYRAQFIAEAVWDLSESLKALGSGLFIRLGNLPEVVDGLARGLAKKGAKVGAVWMTSHEGSEEKADEKDVASLCEKIGAKWKLWVDEKYFIDDRDTGLKSIEMLPDVFTTYRKMQEPLREKPRAVLPPIEKGSLPPLIDAALVSPQPSPFRIPDTLDGLAACLVAPVKDFLSNKPDFPKDAKSAHPYKGGETAAHERLNDFLLSGAANMYEKNRNGLLGTDFSTKLSAFLAQGCITARQVHAAMDAFERGTDPKFKDIEGFGAYTEEEATSKDKAENPGIHAVRVELLWRDFLRLCHQKSGNLLFHLWGSQKGCGPDDGSDGRPQQNRKWKSPVEERALPQQTPDAQGVAEILERFNAGTMGMGLIDASQRELLHTGYTSNRARQNVASFLAKHLQIDWRYGAEWYEMVLADYDVSSNWANWQYVSGVGNDPRGEIRIFNPVKQAFDYDKDGSYVRKWLPEVSKLQKLETVFQPCTASEEDLKEAGLVDNIMVTKPVLRIDFCVDAKPRSNRRQGFRRGGRRGGGGSRRTNSASLGREALNAGENGNVNGNVNGNRSVNVHVNVSGSGNGSGNTQLPRTDAPVVNGTTRGPKHQGSGYRGSFGGSRGSPGGGRGSFNGGGGYNSPCSPAVNLGNGTGYSLTSTNGGGPRHRGGGQQFQSPGRGGYGGGSPHRGGQNGNYHRGNGNEMPPPANRPSKQGN